MYLRHVLRIIMMLSAAVTTMAQQTSAALPPAGFQFTGTWDCVGSFANGKPHHSTFNGSLVLKNTWIRLEESDVSPASGYVAEYLIGYDASTRKVVEYDANNFSGATYTSDEGWQGSALTLTSAIASDPKASYQQNRFIFHVDSPDTFTMDWQVRRTSAPEWTPADHLPCKRISPKQ
ncbi:hypothetical protein [Granulicella sp. S156]|uniref:hypothetical protein n=1 Tax=Granulicella sp. S156 TaxID=1747224 RepID=UPI00131EA563|nr:hypothetical protein [Granulicella sp. S156]